MRGIRRAEAICGIIAAVYGCAATAVIGALIYNGSLPATKPEALFFMALAFGAFLAVGVGAAWHALGGGAIGIALLWPGAVIAGLMTYLGVFSIGIFILPGTMLAVVASCMALARIPTLPRHPSALGWVELLSGVAVPVAGIAGLYLLLYWSSIYYNGPNRGGYFSRATLNGLATTLPLFLGGVLLSVLVGFGAAAHAIAHAPAGRVLLWLATLLLAAATALAFAGLSINAVPYLALAGPYLVPALILAAIAALTSLIPTTRVNANATPTPTPAPA